MKAFYLVVASVVFFSSCHSSDTKREMIHTSNQIMQKLRAHDSTAVSGFFVHAPHAAPRHSRNLNDRITEAFLLCEKYSPSDISQYTVRTDTADKTIYNYFVEIPFTDSLASDTEKITIEFANYFGYKQAVDMHIRSKRLNISS